MLLGSRSGFPATVFDGAGRVVAVEGTCEGWVTPVVRSVTGASCLASLLAQPAATAAMARYRATFFISLSLLSLLTGLLLLLLERPRAGRSVRGHRAPGGILDVPGRRGEALAHAPVAGVGGEVAAAPDGGFVENHLTVRGVRRGIVEPPLGDVLPLPRPELQDRDPVAAALARDVGDRLSVGAVARAHVVAALEGEALGLAARGRHPVDLRRPPAIGGERDPLAVGRVRRLRVDAARVGEALGLAAVRGNAIDLGEPVLGERDQQLLAVRRPGRGAVVAPVV